MLRWIGSDRGRVVSTHSLARAFAAVIVAVLAALTPASAQVFCEPLPGTAIFCPCFNFPSGPGRGCDNSAATGGALLAAAGTTSPDTVVLTASDELPTSLSIFLQGDASNANGVVFGDGVRCAAGVLRRIGVKNASGGTVSYPQAGDPSISARSAALGDPLFPGATRHYQVYYRDPSLGFCAAPTGNSFNIGNALAITW